MELSVRYLLELRVMAGVKEEQLAVEEGTDVLGLLGTLLSCHPSLDSVFLDSRTGAFQLRVRVLVNGRDIKFLGGMNTALVAGDLVSVQPITR